MPSSSCRALLINPRYVTSNVLVYQTFCEALGFGSLIPPLGLLTVAALLPRSWELRLIDRNFQTMTTDDLDQADIVLTGGMMTQKKDILEVIRLAQARGKPVVVGGPDITSSPHLYSSADFQLRGEAEGVMDAFLAAWNSGARSGVFEAERFQADVTKSPIPRYDLIGQDYYLYAAVQFSRGCPFTCEFCDIIELYGRTPRTKKPEQMLAELDALYRLGFRGPAFFVDDNLVGNKKELRNFLPLLREWQKERGYPFQFATQASLNLGDDPVLLTLLSECNFFSVFYGIESPDPETLISMKKKQNAIRDLTESVANVHRHGMFVSAGIVIGFDAEKGSVADGIVDYIEAASISIINPGLLISLPSTQLGRRLEREGRLFPNAELTAHGDQCIAGLNFDTARPRRDILRDLATVLDRLYSPEAYYARLRRQGEAVKRPPLKERVSLRTSMRMLVKFSRLIWKISISDRKVCSEFWYTLVHCARKNRSALKFVMATSAMYFDLGPFCRNISAQLRHQIDLIDRGEWQPPAERQAPKEPLRPESLRALA